MENIKHIALIYTDGSAMPNPGPYGGGAHGYIYVKDKIEKNNDVPTKITITTQGYVRNEDIQGAKVETLKPVCYIDALYSYAGEGTNNMGEVLAAIETLNKLLEIEDIDLETVHLLTDSMYVINLFDNITTSNNKWRDDTNRPNFNLWVKFSDIIDIYNNKNIIIKLHKVKAHDVNFGNNIVDTLALIARERSAKNVAKIDFNVSEGKKYWKPKIDRHPFLKYNEMFFNSTVETINGYDHYTILKYPSDVELGKKSPEVSYAVIKLSEQPKEIEQVKSMYKEYCGTTRVLSYLSLKNLFSRNFQHYYKLFGNDALLYNKRNRYLELLGNEPIIATVNPPGLANKAVKYTVQLRDYMDYYLKNETIDGYRDFIDVTSFFYKENKFLLNNVKNIELSNLEIFNSNFTIIPQLGLDLPDRNQLKSLEKLEPKISILMMKESERIIRYYFIIELKKTNDIGVWTSMYSNYIVIGG